MKTQNSNSGFRLSLVIAMLQLALRSGGGTLEAPFTRITNGVMVTESAMSISAAWGDFDNDGWLDLFVGNYHATNSIYRNNRDGTFTKVTTNAIATEPPAHPNGAAWADYDNDTTTRVTAIAG